MEIDVITFGDLYVKYIKDQSPKLIQLNTIMFGTFRPRTTAGLDKIQTSVQNNKGKDSDGIITDR
ncbi:MAG: hypothetical protein ACRDFB_02810 [Rhabdochlamydiaceae bacterium]